ncbi:MAG: 3'-5' exonuclease domain-containing protein 2 [Prevotella sp.]|nr:3'-5' exonuclease domain-containing protein 2 [Prevotella sp.]
MKKIIYNKFDKNLIPDLPKVVFQGRIFVITTPDEAAKAVDYLLSQPILGVDTETRPSFKKGQTRKVSLLQVASHDSCFLFRLNLIGLTDPLIRLLEDTTVPKIGLSLRDDIQSLRKRKDFNYGKFIDLQRHVGELGVTDMSLQKLYANFFHEKISKTARLSNWENDVLTEKQKSYAATDAWACIMLYEELQRLENTGDYVLITVKDDASDNLSEISPNPQKQLNDV